VAYQKLEHGPAPRRLVPVRDGLVAQGAAEVRHESYRGRELDRVVPTRSFRRDVFDDEELRSVDAAVGELWEANATEASDRSHRELGWRMVPLYADIPYETAYLAPAFRVTVSMREHAAELAERLKR
jgi:hypothetical protein